MIKLLLALLITLSLNAEEFYLQEDKQKHFIGSIAIGAAAAGIARHYGSNKIEAVAIGIASSLLIGIAKEKWDGAGHGTEDVQDIYSDALGGITGSVISSQFSWKF